MLTEIITRSIAEPEKVTTRIIDFKTQQTWLRNHMWFAWHNGFTVTFAPIVATDTLGAS